MVETKQMVVVVPVTLSDGSVQHDVTLATANGVVIFHALGEMAAAQLASVIQTLDALYVDAEVVEQDDDYNHCPSRARAE